MKKLAMAIEFARKIINEEQILHNLQSINSEILEASQQRLSPISKKNTLTIMQRIKLLKKVVKSNLFQAQTEDCSVDSDLITKEISFFIIKIEKDCQRAEEICNQLIDLFGSHRVNKQLVKILKYLSEDLSKSSFKSYQKIAKTLKYYLLRRKLKKTHKKLKKEILNQIPPKAQLRKHVCRKFAKLIYKYKKTPKKYSQILSINQEAFIRSTDPSMGEKYISNCKKKITDLKNSLPLT